MYTNQQSKLSYRVKSQFSHHFMLNKLNFAQLKLNFKIFTCKNLEHSYKFFQRIEEIRLLAIDYYEEHSNFTGFRLYLKRLRNDNLPKDFDSEDKIKEGKKIEKKQQRKKSQKE